MHKGKDVDYVSRILSLRIRRAAYGEIFIKRQQGCIRAEILLMLRGLYKNRAP